MSKYIELDSGTHTIGSFYPADRGGTVVAENSHPIVCFPDISYSAFKTAFMATAEGAYVDVEPLHDRPPAGMVRNPPSPENLKLSGCQGKQPFYFVLVLEQN